MKTIHSQKLAPPPTSLHLEDHAKFGINQVDIYCDHNLPKAQLSQLQHTLFPFHQKYKVANISFFQQISLQIQTLSGFRYIVYWEVTHFALQKISI